MSIVNWSRATWFVAVVAAAATLGGCGDDGKTLKVAIVHPGAITRQGLGQLEIARMPSSQVETVRFARDGFTLRFPHAGDAKRYRDLLTAPGVVTMSATPTSAPVLEPADFADSSVYVPGLEKMTVGFSRRGMARFAAFARGARGAARGYVIMVDGRVVLHGSVTAKVADEHIGGVVLGVPRAPREVELLAGALHSGPLKSPLRVVSD